MQDTGAYGFDVALYRMPAEETISMNIKIIHIRQYTK